MVNYELVVILSYSIAIAAIIGLIRLRKIIRPYRPFVFILFLSLISEIVHTILSRYLNTNSISANIYVLLECFLWLWQFSCWGAFSKNRAGLWVLACSLAAVWVAEHIWMEKIFTFSSMFRISYSFVLVFLAIDQLNLMIVNEKKNLLRTSRFLICFGITFFYSFKIIVESFYLFELALSKTFYTYLYLILIFMNVFVNLIFALAALWVPTRQKFILPS